MNFSDGLADARKLAESALAAMQQNDVPPTPSNFKIWYAHASGKIPDLSKEVEQLLDQPAALTPERSEEIYNRYLNEADGTAAVQQTGAKMERELADVLAAISEATGDAEHFQESLQENLRDLTKDQGIEGITKVMRTLVDEAQKMQSSNSELQKRLETSSKEIVTLRENLEEVQKEALTDGLTGIANRKRFDAVMDSSIERATATGEPICLAMTDIDFFKAFNDNYGHQTGDQVLKLVAKILESSVRDGELAARYGGEEFGLIMPGANLEDAHAVCERVRELVSSKQIRNRNTGESMGNITLSLGVAIFKPGDTVTDMIQRADAGLYFAKQHGRNQTVLETQLEATAAAG